MKRHILGFCVFWLVAGLFYGRGADWPQLQCTPQRTGRTELPVAPRLEPDKPRVGCTSIQLLFTVDFFPERLANVTQPIVRAGRIFNGTMSGNFYAHDVKSGERLWKFSGAGPIVHTAGAADGKVFFGSLDGSVYALNEADGRLEWKFEAGPPGFSVAALLAEGKVFMGGRDGVFYALRQADGSAVWRTDLGAPIAQSAAYDGGRVFVGTQAMQVYALDAGSGEVLWKSARLPG